MVLVLVRTTYREWLLHAPSPHSFQGKLFTPLSSQKLLRTTLHHYLPRWAHDPQLLGRSIGLAMLLLLSLVRRITSTLQHGRTAPSVSICTK
jgi:hypothetical protein